MLRDAIRASLERPCGGKISLPARTMTPAKAQGPKEYPRRTTVVQVRWHRPLPSVASVAATTGHRLQIASCASANSCGAGALALVSAAATTRKQKMGVNRQGELSSQTVQSGRLRWRLLWLAKIHNRYGSMGDIHSTLRDGPFLFAWAWAGHLHLQIAGCRCQCRSGVQPNPAR